MAVRDVRETYRVNVVAFCSDDEITRAPAGSAIIPGRALVHLVGAFDRVQRLKDETGISRAVTWLPSESVGAEDQG